MNHILKVEDELPALYDIFRKMRESNTILFLGAGASVGEKTFLSKQIIELYEQYMGRSLGIQNITEWVDILSADPEFSRTHFDNFVAGLLSKLRISEAHKTLATVPWNQIITTNYDLLVEQAYDEIGLTSERIYDLQPVRNLKEFSYRESNSEVKYVKLNGCMQDKSQFPFAFSNDDFDRLKPFYRNVLNELRNISRDINFLSIGYSYSDAFAKDLMAKFDSYNFRDKKWMINVDPYPNESALPFYSKNRICVIKLSFHDFFEKYKNWEHSQTEIIVRKRGLSILDSKNQYVSLPPKLLINLDGVVRQLSINNANREKVIKDSEFYRGEEPNFSIVTRGLDVVKLKYLNQFAKSIEDIISQNKSSLIPVFFVSGDFGIGKSTFTLRLIYELSSPSDNNTLAFDILDINRLKKEVLFELIDKCKCKRILLFVDDVEVESYFKSVLDLQRELSIEQIQETEVVLIVPIRENMLEKFRLQRTIPNSFDLKLDGVLSDEEIDDLLEKLKNSGLISFRDAREKESLKKKVQKDFNADSFISLMSIITSGRHENDLLDSYNQLSKEAKEAFLYTALLHKHKLLMPASLLKKNVSGSWDDFINKIVKAEGKGLLIQEERTTYGVQPDLYFRTKHPLIAERLVSKILPNIDKQFTMYETMLRGVEPGVSNSYLVNNLLKGFVKSDELNDVQINKLFDAANTKLSDDPYFLLNYAINLQSRRTISDLRKALDLLVYGESLLENRNHRFIHRRGVISFELAKLYADEGSASYRDLYRVDAEDLFFTKQLMDPFSFYSYVDYIRLLLWEIREISLDKEEIIQRLIKIEDLFDVSSRVVEDGMERINSLSTVYADCIREISDQNDYRIFLESLYEDFHLKPYACILLYNHYAFHGDEAANRYLEEMEYYQDNFEVVKFLFKYYGRRLYNANIRIKLMKMSRENPSLEKHNSLRYHFFNFIAESYNYQFSEGRRYLFNIQTRGFNINPEFHELWCDSNGEEAQFDAIINRNKYEKFKSVKIPQLQQNVKLKRGSYEKLVEGSKVRVRLHFHLYGLIAEVI